MWDSSREFVESMADGPKRGDAPTRYQRKGGVTPPATKEGGKGRTDARILIRPPTSPCATLRARKTQAAMEPEASPRSEPGPTKHHFKRRFTAETRRNQQASLLGSSCSCIWACPTPW